MANFECRGLGKRFGQVQALESVDITVQPGRVVGLLGPNGSRKTTLIKLANGLLTPDDGVISICGSAPGPETRAMVSYLPDRPMLPQWMRAQDLVKFYADFYSDFDTQRAQDMLARLGVPADRRIKQMSKGTQEKVQLILVMSRRAKLYLLDEPIGGVDPATRDFILATILNNFDGEASILISTHLISDVEKVLDDVVFINNGRVLLTSSVDDIREKNGMSVDALFREVFKC